MRGGGWEPWASAAQSPGFRQALVGKGERVDAAAGQAPQKEAEDGKM